MSRARRPRVVASEDYDSAADRRGRAGCSYRLTHAVPEPERRDAHGPPASAAGPASCSVRVTDTGGNVTDQRAVHGVNVIPPFDRGPLNGTNATEDRPRRRHLPAQPPDHADGSLQPPRHDPRARLQRVRATPVGGAIVHVLRKDERANSRWRTGTTIHTRADGRFTYRTRATRRVRCSSPGRRTSTTRSPRRAGTCGCAPRRRRASASARATSDRPALPRLRPAARLRVPRVPASSCSCRRQRGRWRLVKKVRASRTGRFSTTTRFTQPSPRRVVRFRVFIPAGPDFPYAAGVSNASAVRLN